MADKEVIQVIITNMANEIAEIDKQIKELKIQKDSKSEGLSDQLLLIFKTVLLVMAIGAVVYFGYRPVVGSNIGGSILLFGVGAIILELIVVLYQEAIWNPGDCVRLVGLTVIVTFVVFLAVNNSAIRNKELFTATIGFLGTTAGYLAGSMGRRST